MEKHEEPTFGELLRQHRLAANLTQALLAERAGISTRGIQDLERGLSLPHRETLRRVLAAMELSLQDQVSLRAVASPTPRRRRVPQEVRPSRAQPRSVTPPVAPDVPIVGREDELARVAQLLGAVAVRSTGGRLLFVAGEPGVGKSRLAHELMARADAAGFRVLVGRCFEQHATSPFFPFNEALGSALARMPSRVRGAALEQWPELAVLVPDLGTPAPRPRGEDGRLRVFRAATHLVRTLADDRPVAFLLEDLHWADSASLGLLLFLGRHLQDAPVLLVGTYRDLEVDEQHPLALVLRELRRERRTLELTLRGLAERGTRDLICARLAVEDIPAEFVAGVHKRTAGNPFFIEEMLSPLVEHDGSARALDEAWAHQALRAMTLPPSVRSVILDRTRRLPREAQELLAMASVLGEAFEFDVLLAMAGQPEKRVLQWLDATFAARLLALRPGLHGERYAFGHALIQESIYADQLGHRVRRLHRRAAEALERLRGDEPATAAELERHYLAAGAPERVARYAIQAGDYASGRYAHAEAAQHYATALDHLVEPQDAATIAEVRYKRGVALTDGDRPDEAIGALQDALASYERLGDTRGQARSERRIAWVHQARYDVASAAPHLHAALRLWPAGHEDHEFVALLLDTARARSLGAEFARAEPLIEQGRALAERLGDQALVARALVESTLLQSNYDTAPGDLIGRLERAEPLARAAGDWLTLCRLHTNLGWCRLKAGDLEGMRSDIRRAIAAGERAGSTYSRIVRSLLAEACMHLGAWEEGRANARAACIEDDSGPAGSCGLLAWMGGDHQQALLLLQKAVEGARRRGDLGYVVGYLGTAADFAIQLERHAEAYAAAQEAVTIVRTHGIWRELDYAFGPLAEVSVVQDSDTAEALVSEAVALLDRHHHALGRPQVMRAQGLLDLRRGDPAKAIQTLTAGAEVARAQRAAVQLGRTLAVLAAAARQRGDVSLATAADSERMAIVEGIGPRVRGLGWAAMADL